MNEVKKSNGTARFVVWIFLAAIVVLADQLTKWAIVEWVPLYDSVPVNEYLNITHQKNPGAAFSFLADAGGWQRWFFTALASGVSLFIIGWLWTIRQSGFTVLSAGLAQVLGGAVGNLVDRVRLGHVTDFIQVHYGGWAFPSFNVADAAISIGAALLIIDAIFLSGREERAREAETRRAKSDSSDSKKASSESAG